MNEREARRARLLARSRSDRQRIAQALEPLAGPLLTVDRTWAGLRWMRERPFAIAAAVAAGSALSIYWRRRGSFSLAALGLRAWRASHLAYAIVSAFRQRPRNS